MATLSGTISSLLCGALNSHFDAKHHNSYYGYIVCAFALFSYMGSLPFFILAGREYEKVKKKEV